MLQIHGTAWVSVFFGTILLKVAKHLDISDVTIETERSQNQ